MAISLACGSTVNSPLTAGVWTEIQVYDRTPVEIHVGCQSLTDVQYAYGVADGGSLTLGIPITGSVWLRPPGYGGRLAVRSTLGGTVAVSAVS